MADYSNRYLFEARVRGLARASRDLDTLTASVVRFSAAAGTMPAGALGPGGVLGGTGAGTGTGTSSGGGGTGTGAAAAAGGGWLPTGRQLTKSLAYGVGIGTAFGAIQLAQDGVRRWVEAQVEFNRVMIDTSITLGGTSEEVAAFADNIRYLAYVSGESFAEASLVARREEVLNRPGLSGAAAGLNVVFPSLDLSTSAEDITAISTQFKIGFSDINDVLLALVQTSGLTVDSILDMSETWGPLVDDMRLGARSVESMREVGALMSGMSVVMGETGPVIEQFLRKLERVYTDTAIEETVNSLGVATRDANGEFLSILKIMDGLAKVGPEAYVALEGFFPNQLGQKTKQQLREFITNWDLIRGIVDETTTSTANFSLALLEANSSLDVIGERLGASFKNWLSSVGDLSGASDVLAGIAAGFQNAATRAGPGGTDFAKFSGATETAGPGDLAYEVANRNYEREGAAAVLIGDALKGIYAERDGLEGMDAGFWNEMAVRFVEALPGTFFKGVANPDSQQKMLLAALKEFAKTPYSENSQGWEAESVIQDFLMFMSQEGAEFSDSMSAVGKTARYVEDAFSESSRSAAKSAVELEILSNSSVLASGALIGVADAANWMSQAALAVAELSFSVAQAGAELDEREAAYAKTQEGATAVTNKALRGISPDEWWEGQADLDKMSTDAVFDQKQQDKQAADEAASDAERLSRQQASDWKNLMGQIEAAFDRLISNITKPTQITAGNVERSKIGTYQDQWDEPLLRFNADINNLIAGKPEEYGSMALFAKYIDQDLLGAGLGADQESKESILRAIQEEVSGQYYGLQMTPDFYNADALIASAREFMGREAQSKETTDWIKTTLAGAGIGDEIASEFISDKETPGIIKAATGGWTSDEIGSEIEKYVPDIAGVMTDQFVEVDWAGVFTGSIQTSLEKDYQIYVGLGNALSKPITEGTADGFVSTIVPMILEALSKYE